MGRRKALALLSAGYICEEVSEAEDKEKRQKQKRREKREKRRR